MTESLVLTVIGLDQPGLVEALSDVLLRHGANWEASRMARLGGRFAGILQVTVDTSQTDKLVVALRALQLRGLTVVIEPSGVPIERGPMRRLKLDLVGNDRPGITREVAHALASRGVNVDELTTRIEPAPMSGGMLFKLSAHLSCPGALQVAELCQRLELIANDLMIDLEIEELVNDGPTLVRSGFKQK